MFVLFRCPTCNNQEKVDVPDKAIAVDIKFWIEQQVMPRVAKVHSTLYPFCNETHVDIALPIDKDSDRLGKVKDETIFDVANKTIFDKMD